jgi:TolB-like protein/DNA-binding winged helix-turn-helix (wHTH) protein/Tfp pilus assembly protein PilF
LEPSSDSPHVARFDVFEVDLRSGELRRPGSKIRLQDQPLQILTLLLEHAGQVVGREELEKRLWPDGVVVDFEHSINSAVKRLRKALGDDAEHPRYIETLPRHGYRFIAPVETVAPVYDRRPVRAAHRAALQRLALVCLAFVAIAAMLFALNVAGLRDRVMRAVGARPTMGVPKIESIAVLPLENLSRDPEQEYFADGMTEELITDLGKISALRVISRTSVMRYKGTKKPLPEIARELNVDAIVEGTVRRSGDRVRITANLLHAPTDRHLWAETYERNLRDVLSLQGEVARAIASQIKIKLTPQEQARLASARPVNPEAHRLCLLGRFYWNKRNEEGLRKAKGQFQRAVEIDPTYAPAYAGLADSYLQLANSGFRPPNETMPKAKAAAQKALEIDPSLAQAHTSLAEIYKDYDWDWAASAREFKRAIQLNPNYATAHQWYAEYLSLTRRHAEAIAEAQRAEQLDPLSPVIRVGAATFGGYLYARQYNEAIRRLRDTVSLFPDFAVAYWQLGDACVANDMYKEAIAAYQKAESLSGVSPAEVAALGQAYQQGGMRGYYLWRLQRLREESKHRYVMAVVFAWLFAALGERDQAFSYLEKAYQERDWYLNTLQVNLLFDPLRSDPRFQDLVRRMNFPQ